MSHSRERRYVSNRMVNGVAMTLDSARANLAVGRKVRLQLESIGSMHRVYVDDHLLISGTDDSPAEGLAGIVMRAIPVNTGAWYTLRVDLVNDTTRVFVNGEQVFTTSKPLGPANPDETHSKGNVGIISYKAAAEFDDFLASQP